MKDQPKIARASIMKAVECVMQTGAKQATVYQHPKLTVKATRLFKSDKRSRSVTLVLTMGSPNYRERQFIKSCIKAKEPFPVKKVQFRWFTKKSH